MLSPPITTVAALKPRVHKALNGGANLLSPEAHLKLQRAVLQELSVDLGFTQAPFLDPLIPPPLSPESEDIDVVRRLGAELTQVSFPTAFKSLCMTLASLSTANYHYLQDADYAAHHELYDFMECAWDQLHPTRISPAPYPVHIPPTPPSYSGSPFVDDDQDMADSDSHQRTPTPHPLEKGKMRQVDPVTPSPLPAPSPAPIELVTPAAAATTAAAIAAGKKKGKKAASFASVAAKAASKPGGVELPRQQTKITSHFQTAPRPGKPPPPPVWPSVVLSLTHHTLTSMLQSHADSVVAPALVDVMNRALSASPTHASVRVSAAKWTPKGNLVVFGGPGVSRKTLFHALPTLTSAVSQALPEDPAISSRLNVKWGKVLINSVPTGVVEGHPHAHAPATCWQVLIDNNPSLRNLRVCQLPSWVRRPSLFQPGSQSSLVLTYEDPDGSITQSLLSQRHLYAFGAQCKVKKWRQPPPSPIRRAQQAARVSRTQANQQGSRNLPRVPATVPGRFAAARPVQAGTGDSSEILSDGLTRQQLLDRANTRAASMVAQADAQGRASAAAASKRPPSSPPDGPAGKRLRASSPA